MSVVRNGIINEIAHETQGHAPQSSKSALPSQNNVGDENDDDLGWKINLSPFGKNNCSAVLDHHRVQSADHKNMRTCQR